MLQQPFISTLIYSTQSTVYITPFFNSWFLEGKNNQKKINNYATQAISTKRTCDNTDIFLEAQYGEPLSSFQDT